MIHFLLSENVDVELLHQNLQTVDVFNPNTIIILKSQDFVISLFDDGFRVIVLGVPVTIKDSTATQLLNADYSSYHLT